MDLGCSAILSGAVGSSSSGPPSAKTVGTKSTGGFNHPDGSPCTYPLSVVALLSSPLTTVVGLVELIPPHISTESQLACPCSSLSIRSSLAFVMNGPDWTRTRGGRIPSCQSPISDLCPREAAVPLLQPEKMDQPTPRRAGGHAHMTSAVGDGKV